MPYWPARLLAYTTTHHTPSCTPPTSSTARLHPQGVPFRLVHIDLAAKPRWYSAVNSRGLVPAVQQGSTVHVESADICRWLDASFGGGTSLTPAEPALRREMEELLEGACSGVISAGLDLMRGAAVQRRRR